MLVHYVAMHDRTAQKESNPVRVNGSGPRRRLSACSLRVMLPLGQLGNRVQSHTDWQHERRVLNIHKHKLFRATLASNRYAMTVSYQAFVVLNRAYHNDAADSGHQLACGDGAPSKTHFEASQIPVENLILPKTS